MNRGEHLEWSKERALAYIDKGDLKQAYASIVSDLSKHKDTEGHIAIELGMMLMVAGNLDTTEEMRNFIEGFN